MLNKRPSKQEVGRIFVVALCCLAARDVIAQDSRERKEVVRAGSANLQVTTLGQGDRIVFIPSLGRAVEDFDAVSRRLMQAGYRTILPEPRGIRGSTGSLSGITLHDLAADVAAVIRATSRGPAIIVGHAFGNRVARMVATDHPMLVKRVVLLAVGGTVPMSPETEESFNRVFNSALSKADRIAAIQRRFSRLETTPPFGSKAGISILPEPRMPRTERHQWVNGGVRVRRQCSFCRERRMS